MESVFTQALNSWYWCKGCLCVSEPYRRTPGEAGIRVWSVRVEVLSSFKQSQGPSWVPGCSMWSLSWPDATVGLPGGAVQLHLHEGTQPRCSWQKGHPYREDVSRMRARVHLAWLMYCSETKEFVFGCGWSGIHFITLKSTSDHLDIFRRDCSNGKSIGKKLTVANAQLPMHPLIHLSSISALKLVFLE